MSAIADIIDVGPLTYAGIVVAASPSGGAPPRSVTRFLPEQFLRSDLSRVMDHFATELCRFKTLVLAHPELDLLEALGRAQYRGAVITCVPSILPDAALSIMRGNSPLPCEFVRPSVASLAGVSPLRASVVCVGAQAGPEMQAVPSWTREILGTLRRNWYGDVTLLDPLDRSLSTVPAGWDLIDKAAIFTGAVVADEVHDEAFEE